MFPSRAKTRTLFSFAALVVLAASGCNMYPYYTLEGGIEGREVVIHLDENTKVEVGAGTGVGAGIDETGKMMLGSGGEFVIEKDKARITLKGNPAFPGVSKVEYDGKEIGYHEPIL